MQALADLRVVKRAKVDDFDIRQWVAILAAAMALGMPWAGWAEGTDNAKAKPDADTQLPMVVVTAQKRSENQQDVPIAIATVSADTLKATGVTSIQDLPNAVAGLSVNNTVQSFSPHIRGVGTTSFGPGVESPVALYVDGVYYGSQVMAMTNLNDVEQVSVLKGPQGTLFGRNATGGVIQLTTLEPKQDLSVKLSTELDNYFTSRNFVHVSGGLTDDLVAGISVTYAKQKNGWGNNVFTGDQIHRIDHEAVVRGKVVWTPTDRLTIKLGGDYSNLKNSLGSNVRDAGPSFLPVLTDVYPSNNIYDVANSATNKNTYKGGGGSLQVEYDAGFARLVSISAQRSYEYTSLFDTDPSFLPFELFGIHQKGEQFSQELQLVSKNSGPFTWTAGLFYFWSRERALPLSGAFTGPGADAFGVTAVELDTYTDLRTNSASIFGQGTYEVTAGTNLTAGVRYTRERRSTSGYINAFFDNDFTFPIPLIPTVTDGSKQSKATFRFALDHKFSDNVMGYVSYDRGFKSGGFNGFNPLNPPYNPETLDAYEVGFKTELNDRTLRFNPSVFFYKYKDLQITSLIPPPLPIIVNGSKAELYGVDLEAQWSPAAGLSANFGAEWLHSKFTSYPNGNVSIPLPGGGNDIQFGDLTGRRIPYASKFSATVGLTYDIPVQESKLRLNISDAYNSGYPTEPDNRLNIDSFNILNTSVSWLTPNERLTVTLFGRNLLNKKVPAQLNTTFYGDEADYTNPPRTYGIGLKYNIGR